MTKIILKDIGSLRQEDSAINAINANNSVIQTASDDFLSRSGVSPNQMEASLDMNSQRILNLAAPVDPTDAARLEDVLGGAPGPMGPAGPAGSAGPAGTPGSTGSTGPAGAGYQATSTTSLLTGNSGSKAFTTQSGRAYTSGARVRATSAGTSEWMEGVVTSYSGTTLTITADLNSGTGTHADWNINAAGQQGATGATGASGAGTGDMLKANNLSELPSASTARTNLGLGTAAVQNIGTSGATVPILNAVNTWGAAQAFGVTTATSINKMAITQPASISTLAVANNKTFTVNNTLTLAGTDSTVMTFPSTTDTVVTLGATQTLTNKTISGASNTLTVRLDNTDVTGNLPVTKIVSATNRDSSHFLRGDGTWAAPSSTSLAPSGDVTGATDVASIQAALVANASVSLQAGQFYLNAALNWPDGSPASLSGAGTSVTVINQVSSTANGITVSNTTNTDQMGSIRNLTIKSTTSTGIGISVSKVGHANPAYSGGWLIDNVNIIGFTTGLKYVDSWFTTNSNMYISNQKTTGIYTDSTSGGAGGHTFTNIELINPQCEFTGSIATALSVVTLTVSAVAGGTIVLGDSITYGGVNSTGGPPTVSSFGTGTGGTGTYILSMTGTGAASITKGSSSMKSRRNSAAIHVHNSGGSIWTNIGQEASTYGVLIDPATSSAANFQWFTGCVFDDNARDGIRLDSVNGGTIDGVYFSNCWSAWNSGAACVLGGNVSNPIVDVMFSGCTLQTSQYQGLLMTTGTNGVRINGCSIVDNSSATFQGGTTNTWPGIQIAGATHVTVSGNYLGNRASTDQAYGLQIDSGAADYIIVQGNDTSTSTTKSASLGIINSSAATHTSITGNI